MTQGLLIHAHACFVESLGSDYIQIQLLSRVTVSHWHAVPACRLPSLSRWWRWVWRAMAFSLAYDRDMSRNTFLDHKTSTPSKLTNSDAIFSKTLVSAPGYFKFHDMACIAVIPGQILYIYTTSLSSAQTGVPLYNPPKSLPLIAPSCI